jgi:hypothetical protein
MTVFRYSCHSSTAVRRSSFSKAVAYGLAVPVGIGCRQCPQFRLKGTADPNSLLVFCPLAAVLCKPPFAEFVETNRIQCKRSLQEFYQRRE